MPAFSPTSPLAGTEALHGLDREQKKDRILAHVAKALSAAEQPLKLIGGDDLVGYPPTEFIIQDLLPQSGLAVIYGASGTYKSFLAFHLAGCLATGTSFGGRETAEASVLYVCGEGQGGATKRLRALSEQFAMTDEQLQRLVFIQEAVPLDEPVQLERFVYALLAFEERYEGWPAVVFIDTFARCFGGDENATSEVSRFVNQLGKLADLLGICVCLIHHTGKDAERGPRGSSSLRGAADVMLVVRKSGTSISARVEKAKDSADGEEFLFTPHDVSLECLHTGEELSTKILEPASSVAPQAANDNSAHSSVRTARRKATVADHILQAIREKGGSGLSRAQLRDVLSTKLGNVPAKQTLGDAIKKLVTKGLIAEDGDAFRLLGE